MDALTWAGAFEQLLEARGLKRGQGSNQGLSAILPDVAAELGVPERTARKRLEWADELKSPAPAPVPSPQDATSTRSRSLCALTA